VAGSRGPVAAQQGDGVDQDLGDQQQLGHDQPGPQGRDARDPDGGQQGEGGHQPAVGGDDGEELVAHPPAASAAARRRRRLRTPRVQSQVDSPVTASSSGTRPRTPQTIRHHPLTIMPLWAGKL
jgi:hypothetical protein